MRPWGLKFGPSDANQLRQRRPPPGDQGPLDEVFRNIKGQLAYLWRTVAQEGNGLDILLPSKRATHAAKRFFRTLLQGGKYGPRVLIPDKLGS